MSLTDWVEEGTVVASLVTNIKFTGNSCVKVQLLNTSGNGTGIKRGSSRQAKVLVWIYGTSSNYPIIGHLSYGNMSFETPNGGTWYRYRATFWYDSANDIKWGRVERWVTDAWVQIGTDSNFNSGVPSANCIRLGNTDNVSITYFDAVEVYEEGI